MRSDAERLEDIVEAIDHIQRHARRGRAEFDRNELIRVWVIHHLEIIGEAVRQLGTQTRKREPSVPWEKIAGMRNVLAHGYFTIESDLVWAVVQKDLPALRDAALQLLGR